MTDWVITFTFDLDPAMEVMDKWERGLESLDATVARIPGRGVDVTVYPASGLDLDEAYNKAASQVGQVLPVAPVGVEIVTEAEWARRAEAPTMPELMSAAEIAEELGVARQRVHQLRATAAFPLPLAELRGGAVWDAAAVRRFAQTWERKPGRPPGAREPHRVTYRSSDGRMIDLDYLKSRGISLTKADVDSMPPKELDQIIRDSEARTS